jgi:hypothetical protein
MALGTPGVVIVTALTLAGAVVLRFSNYASMRRTYAQARAEVRQRHGRAS